MSDNNYHPVVCQACHNVVLVNGMDSYAPVYLKQLGWQTDGIHHTCPCNKPKAEAARKPVKAFISYAKNITFMRKVGIQAALQGYDCLNAHPDYIAGHKEGMGIRNDAANLPFGIGVK